MCNSLVLGILLAFDNCYILDKCLVCLVLQVKPFSQLTYDFSCGNIPFEMLAFTFNVYYSKDVCISLYYQLQTSADSEQIYRSGLNFQRIFPTTLFSISVKNN